MQRFRYWIMTSLWFATVLAAALPPTIVYWINHNPRG